MAICCFPNCAYLSETSRMISVYKRLKASCEDVVLATHGGSFEFVLKEEGIPYKHLEPFVTNELSLEWAAISRVEKGVLSGYYSVEELEKHVNSEMAFFNENNVRAVLSGYTLSNALSTRALGIPYVTTHLGSWVPPVFEFNMNPWPVNGDNIFTRFIPASVKIKMTNYGILRVRTHRPINILAKKLNIPEFKNFLDLTSGDLTLVTDCPEILGIPAGTIENWVPKNPKLFNHELKMKYVGPIFAELFGEIPDRVKSFYNTQLPKIYVALATSRPDYMEAVLSILKDMEVKVIICTAVHNLKNGSHPNILIEKHLPSHKVMPLADLAIIHGGQGSVQTAISASTPVLGFPLHPEQDFNLRLVEKNGGGICVSLKNLKKKKFREHIERIISD